MIDYISQPDKYGYYMKRGALTSDSEGLRGSMGPHRFVDRVDADALCLQVIDSAP